MSNNYFAFKQFRIEQDACAMKVTTDACIQGAWTPVLPRVKRILDIGAGSGLLALMLTQRTNTAIIDAVEFDASAATQAQANSAASPWADRLRIHEADVRGYSDPVKYDMIITNPPFFNNSLLGDKERKNMARHTLSLSYTELLAAMAANVADDGYLSILLPATEYEQWKTLALSNGWYEVGKLSVCHRPNAAVKRTVGLFSLRNERIADDEQLTIQDASGAYTVEFSKLLAPFYLNL
jgi:tRNA1Val (adenine37-N6)-methyltransferase